MSIEEILNRGRYKVLADNSERRCDVLVCTASGLPFLGCLSSRARRILVRKLPRSNLNASIPRDPFRRRIIRLWPFGVQGSEARIGLVLPHFGRYVAGTVRGL